MFTCSNIDNHVVVCHLFRFEPRTDQNYYVDIVPGSGGCYAYIPYWGEKKLLGHSHCPVQEAKTSTCAACLAWLRLSNKAGWSKVVLFPQDLDAWRLVCRGLDVYTDEQLFTRFSMLLDFSMNRKGLIETTTLK